MYFATITVLSEIDDTTNASLNPSNGGQSKIIISKSFFSFCIKFKNLTFDNSSDGFGGYTPAVITDNFWILVDFT